MIKKTMVAFFLAIALIISCMSVCSANEVMGQSDHIHSGESYSHSYSVKYGCKREYYDVYIITCSCGHTSENHELTDTVEEHTAEYRGESHSDLMHTVYYSCFCGENSYEDYYWCPYEDPADCPY